MLSKGQTVSFGSSRPDLIGAIFSSCLPCLTWDLCNLKSHAYRMSSLGLGQGRAKIFLPFLKLVSVHIYRSCDLKSIFLLTDFQTLGKFFSVQISGKDTATISLTE